MPFVSYVPCIRDLRRRPKQSPKSASTNRQHDIVFSVLQFAACLHESGMDSGGNKPNSEATVVVHELSDHAMVVDIEGCSLPMANSIRRACMAEVCTLAIDEVLVHTNTTAEQDEFIAHRLGLVPLRNVADPQLVGMRRRGHCTCDRSCPRCELVMHVWFENTTCGYAAMTSRDLECTRDVPVVPVHYARAADDEAAGRATESFAKSSGGQCTAVRRTGHRIIQAGPGSVFHATCRLRMGNGAEHVKWSPVTVCTFSAVADAATSTPRGGERVVGDSGGGGGPAGLAEYDERSSPPCTRYRFTIETNGQLTPAEVLASALDILRQKVTP